jgi:S-adenosyl-L-methionine hydrolase (adenosine-forming)
MTDTPRPVVLLTDFGIADDFAGVCHGVILQRAPGTQVIHLTHGIAPQAVLQGALVLRGTLRYMPTAVTMAVVDPGVGTERRAIAIDAKDGRSFVGPDNGLLIPAVEEAGGVARCVSLESPDHRLEPVAPTFHGRDVFAPAAAHLAAGGAISDLGPALDPDSLTPIEIPVPRPAGDSLIGQVWSVDRFGNASLNLGRAEISEVLGDASRAELVVGKRRYYAALAETFANVRPGELLLYVDPYGFASVAVNRGSASDMFDISPGDEIAICPLVEA